MDASNEQPAAIATAESASASEQEHNDEAMEETEEYNYEGDDYRHFMPRGRGGFRCVSRRAALRLFSFRFVCFVFRHRGLGETRGVVRVFSVLLPPSPCYPPSASHALRSARNVSIRPGS